MPKKKLKQSKKPNKPQTQNDSAQPVQAFFLRTTTGETHTCHLIAEDLSLQLLHRLGHDADALTSIKNWLNEHGKVWFYPVVADTVLSAFPGADQKGFRCYVIKSNEAVALLLSRAEAMMIVGYGPRVHDRTAYAGYACVEAHVEDIVDRFNAFDAQYAEILAASAIPINAPEASLQAYVPQSLTMQSVPKSISPHKKSLASAKSSGQDPSILAKIDTTTEALERISRGDVSNHDNILRELHDLLQDASQSEYYFDYHTTKQSFVVYCPVMNDRRVRYLLPWREKHLQVYLRFLHAASEDIWPKIVPAMQYFPTLLTMLDLVGGESLKAFCLQGHLSQLLGVLLTYTDTDAVRYQRVSTHAMSCVLQLLCHQDHRASCLAQHVAVLPILWRLLMRAYSNLTALSTVIHTEFGWYDATQYDFTGMMRAMVEAPRLYHDADLCVAVYVWLFTEHASASSSQAIQAALLQCFLTRLADYCKDCSSQTMAMFPDNFLAIYTEQEKALAAVMPKNKMDQLRAQRNRCQQDNQPQVIPAHGSSHRMDNVSEPRQAEANSPQMIASPSSVMDNSTRQRARDACAKRSKKQKSSPQASAQSARSRLHTQLALRGQKQGFFVNGRFYCNPSESSSQSFAANGSQDRRVVAVRQLIDQGEAGYAQLKSNAITRRLRRFNRIICPLRISAQGAEFPRYFPVVWHYDPSQSAYLGTWRYHALEIVEQLWLDALNGFFTRHNDENQAVSLQKQAKEMMPMLLDRHVIGLHFDLLAQDQTWLIEQSATILQSLSHLDTQAMLLHLQQDEPAQLLKKLTQYFDSFIILQRSQHAEIKQSEQDYANLMKFSSAMSQVSTQAIRIDYKSRIILYMSDIFHDSVSDLDAWMHGVAAKYFRERIDAQEDCISLKLTDMLSAKFKNIDFKQIFLSAGYCADIGYAASRKSVSISYVIDDPSMLNNSAINMINKDIFKYVSEFTPWYYAGYLRPNNRENRGVMPELVDLNGWSSHLRFFTTLASAPAELFVLFNTRSNQYDEYESEIHLFYADDSGQPVQPYDNQQLRNFMQQWMHYLRSSQQPEAKKLAEILDYCDGSKYWDWTPAMIKRWSSIFPLAFSVTQAIMLQQPLPRPYQSQLQHMHVDFLDAQKAYQQAINMRIEGFKQTALEARIKVTTNNSFYLATMQPFSQTCQEALVSTQVVADDPVLLDQGSTEKDSRLSDVSLFKTFPTTTAALYSRDFETLSIDKPTDTSSELSVGLLADPNHHKSVSDSVSPAEHVPQTPGAMAQSPCQSMAVLDFSTFEAGFKHFFHAPIVIQSVLQPSGRLGIRAGGRVSMLLDDKLPQQDGVITYQVENENKVYPSGLSR